MVVEFARTRWLSNNTIEIFRAIFFGNDGSIREQDPWARLLSGEVGVYNETEL